MVTIHPTLQMEKQRQSKAWVTNITTRAWRSSTQKFIVNSNSVTLMSSLPAKLVLERRKRWQGCYWLACNSSGWEAHRWIGLTVSLYQQRHQKCVAGSKHSTYQPLTTKAQWCPLNFMALVFPFAISFSILLSGNFLKLVKNCEETSPNRKNTDCVCWKNQDTHTQAVIPSFIATLSCDLETCPNCCPHPLISPNQWYLTDLNRWL